MKTIAIVEFGSSARLDSDKYSDRDFFILVERFDDLEMAILDLKLKFSYLNKPNAEFIVNDVASFNRMLKNGSLFLWHLKLEAKPVYGSDEFWTRMKNLNAFTEFESTFYSYLEVLEDLSNARKKLPTLTHFDYSVLFSVVRNLSILGCYKLNSPKFGRVSAFKELIKITQQKSISYSDYIFLMRKKIEYERGFFDKSDTIIDIDLLIQKAYTFSNQVKNLLNIE